MDRIVTINDGYPITYEYDIYGQLIRENNEALDKTYTYEYNSIGNITRVKEYAYHAPEEEELPRCQKTVFYGYDAECPDKLTKFDGNAIEYNSIGCPSKYKDEDYEWANGKLSKIHRSTVIRDDEHYTTRTFTYDGYGRRTQKYSISGVNLSGEDAVNSYSWSQRNDYTYDNSGRLIREVRTDRVFSDEESTTRELVYLYDESGMIGVMFNSQPYYYHRNLQGDVIAIYDASGQKQVEYAYDAWGNCEIVYGENNELANANPIRYRGYYYDTETGLYYLNARYYSPEWRRFISPDAAEYIDSETPNGLNLYAYCYNDPVNYADPSGHDPEWWQWILASVAVAGAITASVLTMGTATPVLAGMLIGGAVSAGFEIGSQVIFGGGVHDIGAILSATLGGMVAGAISGIPVFGGFTFGNYVGTAVLGGGASIVGGVVSGGVHDINSFLIALSLGVLGNVAAKAVNQLVVNRIAGKIMNSSYAKGRSLAINNYMIKHNVKPRGLGHSTFGGWSRNLFKDMSKEFFKTVVTDTTSRSAIVYSALISSSISGWY